MDDHASVSIKWADREEIGINALIGKGGEQTFSLVFFTSLYPREVSFHFSAFPFNCGDNVCYKVLHEIASVTVTSLKP